jgi:hypothetical protein
MIITLKEVSTGQVQEWTVNQMLDFINADRNPEWIPYTKDDWENGWTHFGAPDEFEIISIK